MSDRDKKKGCKRRGKREEDEKQNEERDSERNASGAVRGGSDPHCFSAS